MRELGQGLIWPKIFHTTVYKLENSWLVAANHNLGWAGTGHRVVSTYIAHHLFFLGFITSSFSLSLSHPLPLFITDIIIGFTILFYFISVIKLFLFQPTNFNFFQFSSPLHQGGELGSSCMVPSCSLGLNHDTGSHVPVLMDSATLW